MKIPHDWSFNNSEVASEFDTHVREQLPWYDLTTGIVSHFARHYIPDKGVVYDIGASTGNIGKAMADTLRVRNAKFTAIDYAEAMASKYSGPGSLTIADAVTYDFLPFDFAVCFLVLMFIPPVKRGELVQLLRARMRKGGAILIFEKEESIGGYPATVLSRLALAGKIAAGVNPNEVIAKELSLCGVQRPLNRKELGEDAKEIFRFGEFVGWIIEKGF